MTIKKKVSTKRVLKSIYDTATVFYGDGEYWTFKLSEWALYIDYDWIEVVKKDKTGMEMYAVVNVSRISFSMNDVKETSPKGEVVSITGNDPILKPVA
jgi:hypothetical protein